MSVIETPLPPHPLSPVIRRVRGVDMVTWFAVVVLGLLAFIAIFGPMLAPQDPNATNLSAVLQGSSSEHLLGTDASGRDLFSRLLAGGRSALLAPLVIALAATAIGTAIAIVSAWFGGITDRALARCFDVVFGFPGLLLAILAVAVFGVGLQAPVLALTIVYIPYVGRIVRSGALREVSLPYVEAAKVRGFSGRYICIRHLLPNVRRLVVAQAVLCFSYAVVDVAAINFLGLGVQPPQADWGAMVASGEASLIGGNPQESLYAGLLIVLAVLSVSLLGDRLLRNADAVVL